ncbi:hypothetical protein [Streptomyces sp. NPDC087300]|uniref:hypothetical protein n=1 Tax=Streptomyces sp. NPDC087300 TaxID=3365780 RepID=UPI0037FCF97C
MVRNITGSILALIGAAAAVYSPFQAWYDGRHGRNFRLDELFSGAGVTDAKAELFGSVFLPFVVAALIALIGVVLRSRLLVALAGVLVLGFTVLWMVRQGQAEGSLTIAGDGSGLGQGLLNSLGGGIFLLLGAALMSGRGRRKVAAPRHEPAPEWDPGPSVPTLDGDGWPPRTPQEPMAQEPPVQEPPVQEPPTQEPPPQEPPAWQTPPRS